MKRFDCVLCSGMVPSSFAVPNSKVSGFGDLEPFAAMSVSMPATLAAFAGAATSLAPSSRLFSVSLALVGGRVASLLEAPCGLVDPGAQAAAAVTVAVFSVNAFGCTLIMLPEGCVPGAVAGSSRSLSSWSVVDAGAAAVFPVMSVVAAAKHEAASVLKQVNGTAAASCPVAAAAALLGLFTVCEGTEIDSAAGLIASVDDIDQMNGAAAAQHEFVSDLLLLLLWSATVCLLAGVSTFLCSWFLGFWSFGETDRLRAMSSISGPGINAFSWGRGCKGMLKNKEREVFASFSSTVTHVQVTSYGTLAENFWAPVLRQLWTERHKPIINRNDVRSAVVVETVLATKAVATFEGASSCVQSGTLEAREFQPVPKVQFFVKGKVGRSTSIVRGGLDEILSHVIGTGGLDVYAMLHGKIVDLSSLCLLQGLLVIAQSTFTIDSEEEVVRTCLGSGRVHNVSRRVAGQCVNGATGVVRQGRICLSLLKGKGMGKWMLQLGRLVENRLLLRGKCRPQHVGHKSCLLEVRLEQGLGVLLLLNHYLCLPLKNWSRHFSSFRVS